ncbi:hypothetical protein F0562_006942 [Nyssa sinensis]|uniref:C3H1-type domain-containing protein n=1 Tax=Nyssa sinensis TaxID=561372 RepID=A0A5J5A4X1_9ASTE|nr:hypothetical protein F0562_006942 [Nyssa sinensis]
MMMMIRETARPNPTVQIPPWDLLDDPTSNMVSPYPISGVSVNFNGNAGGPNGDNCSLFDAMTALQRYLPSNINNSISDSDIDLHGDDCEIPVDAFSCDHFRMFEFKVRKCARGRSHDWTECPYAHPGEKARRRDPRKHQYSGTACAEFRKGQCKKGDSCEFAHGVFECWLHPARYRTQPCKDGTLCRRRVCFFAHNADQLRVLPQSSPRMTESYDGSPSRLGFDSYMARASFGLSPTSSLYSPPVSPPSDSPPMSPSGSSNLSSVNELAASMRNLHIGKARMSMSPPAWGTHMGSGFCSPRSQSTLRPDFLSLPSTPTLALTRSGLGFFDIWDSNCEEEPVMERVESGRDLRAQILHKKLNPMEDVKIP